MNCRSLRPSNEINHNALLMEARERRDRLHRTALQGQVGTLEVSDREVFQVFLGETTNTRNGSVPLRPHHDSLYSLLADGYIHTMSRNQTQDVPMTPPTQAIRRVSRAKVVRVLNEALDIMDQSPY